MKDLKKIKNKFIGNKGEAVAENFLKEKGYKFVERNFKNKIGEIDLIFKDKDVLVFVEVKTRETLIYGKPIESIGLNKQNKIRKVAEIYLMLNNKSFEDVRFDVVEVVGDKIFHTQNAF